MVAARLYLRTSCGLGMEQQPPSAGHGGCVADVVWCDVEGLTGNLKFRALDTASKVASQPLGQVSWRGCAKFENSLGLWPSLVICCCAVEL